MAGIDTRIQVRDPLENIALANQSSQGLGRNVIAGYQAASQNRQFNLQREDQQARLRAFQEQAQAKSGMMKDFVGQVQAAPTFQDKFKIMNSPEAINLWTDEFTKPGMEQLFKGTMEAYEIDSKTGSIARLAEQKAQSQDAMKRTLDSFKEFQPIDQARIYDMYSKSGYSMTQEIYDFASQAQQRVPKKPETQTTNIRDFEYGEALKENLDLAIQTGDPARIKAAQERYESFQQKTAPTGMRVVTNPDGSTTIETGVQNLTTGARGEAEKRVAGVRKSLELMSSFKNKIRPKDVGFWGVLGDLADRIGPQFGLSSPDYQRQEVRTKIGTLAQTMLRQFSEDSRFSEPDHARIKVLLPDSGLFENAERAKDSISILQDLFAKRVVFDLRDTGASLKYENLSNPHEIKAAALMGYNLEGKKIDPSDPAQARKLYDDVAEYLTKNYPDYEGL